MTYICYFENKIKNSKIFFFYAFSYDRLGTKLYRYHLSFTIRTVYLLFWWFCQSKKNLTTFKTDILHPSKLLRFVVHSFEIAYLFWMKMPFFITIIDKPILFRTLFVWNSSVFVSFWHWNNIFHDTSMIPQKLPKKKRLQDWPQITKMPILRSNLMKLN